jgi:ABC-type polysaccharide/polyol phosphate export permease
MSSDDLSSAVSSDVDRRPTAGFVQAQHGALPAELRVALPPSWRVDPRRFWQDLWVYRELILNHARTQRLSKSTDTFLGPLWWLLIPLFEMLLYWFVVGVLFRSREPYMAVAIFLGLVPWDWFSQTALGGAPLIRGASSLLLQVPLPPGVLVAAKYLDGFSNLLYGYGILFVLALAGGVPLRPTWALIPIILAVYAVIAFAITLVVAAASVFVDDIRHAGVFLLRLLFYLTPIVYPAQRVPERFHGIYFLNPFAVLHHALREVFLEGRPPDWGALGVVAGLAIAMLAASGWLFSVLQQYFHKRL